MLAEKKPPAVRQGDVVALVSPAGPLRDASVLEKSVALIERLGYRPQPGPHALSRYGHLAGTDEERAADLNAAIRDPNVRAIFALRGGYGTMRLLERIDYDAFAADPKIVLGFSDLTALLNALTQRTGIVTFHGPVAALSEFTPLVIESLQAAIARPSPIGTLLLDGANTIVAGTASGRLSGGNLTLLASLCGTPYAVALDGIAFFEEVDESPYRIDRMLTQLRLAEAFASTKGIVVGQCKGCDVVGDPREARSLTLAETLRDRLGDLDIPVIEGALIGHIEEQWTLPVGIDATLDTKAKTLTISEPAVC